MLHIVRYAERSTLRALLLASAVALATGAAVSVARAEPPSQAPAPFVSDRLSVEVVGSGPDVILIPGLASSREVWRAEAERLKATHRVHLVQLAGFAGAPWAHGDGPVVRPAVEDLARYIREAGLRRPAVIGHSLGGLSALMLAQTHPEAVGRIMTVDSLPFYTVLINPAVTAEQAAAIAGQAGAAFLNADDATFAALERRGAEALARDPATRDRIVEWGVASDRHALVAGMRDVMTTDLRPGLASMTTPVTALYASDANGGAPSAMADTLWSSQYAALPDVTLHRIDDSRHFIMADQPEAFARAVDEFLK